MKAEPLKDKEYIKYEVRRRFKEKYNLLNIGVWDEDIFNLTVEVMREIEASAVEFLKNNILKHKDINKPKYIENTFNSHQSVVIFKLINEAFADVCKKEEMIENKN